MRGAAFATCKGREDNAESNLHQVSVFKRLKDGKIHIAAFLGDSHGLVQPALDRAQGAQKRLLVAKNARRTIRIHDGRIVEDTGAVPAGAGANEREAVS